MMFHFINFVDENDVLERNSFASAVIWTANEFGSAFDVDDPLRRSCFHCVLDPISTVIAFPITLRVASPVRSPCFFLLRAPLPLLHPPVLPPFPFVATPIADCGCLVELLSHHHPY